MKKTTTLIIASLINLLCIGQTDIATERLQPLGTTVTITGIATNGAELGVIRYIQDQSAGIAIYDQTTNNYLDSIMRGDSITITGELADYRGLLEINVSGYPIIHSNNNPLPNPQLILPNQIGETTESELVQIDDAVFSAGGSVFAVGSYDFTSNSQQGSIYVRTNHPLLGSFIPVGPVTLIAISSQFTFSVPANDGYQILLRDSNDIIQSSGIVFTSGVTQSNITTTSFDLSWSTSLPSSTNCNYDILTVLGNTINNGGSTQNHTISLSGLSPATFYYVQCYSINGTDTAFSNIGVYSTASNSTGIIRPYFNHSVDISVSTGVNAQNISASFSDTIAAYIGLADSTLDVCVYNASDPTIANAINDAANRGVSVRYIADDDAANIMLGNLDPTIPIVRRDPSPAGIMHNKFIIVDVHSTNNSWVMGGSCNWTNPSNLFNDYNNLIFIQDEAIAKAYTLEFEEMWNGTFGTHKEDNTPHNFIVNGKDVELYFSPSDQTTNKILEVIENVNTTLEFGLLSFTRDDLGQAVIDKDSEFGVTVRGIIEQENVTGSEFSTLVTANVNVLSHQGVSHQLHHKYAIADANNINSDPTIITGSHNWSANAENNSDENTLIIHDHTIANIYLQEFTARFNELNGVSGINDLVEFELDIFPNPSSNGVVYIKTDLIVKKVNLYSANGALISISKSNRVKIPSSGYYIMKVITDKGSVLKKVIVD